MKFGYRTPHMMDNPATGSARVPIVYVKPEIAWEYKQLSHAADSETDTEAVLNELGADGWELVSVITHELGTEFYLKRFAA
ncbi:MAG: DUF4177 domain-containing protein [Chloroflexota bacterium]